jgi:hypothetical protein
MAVEYNNEKVNKGIVEIYKFNIIRREFLYII